jgi:hypothetical protein
MANDGDRAETSTVTELSRLSALEERRCVLCGGVALHRVRVDASTMKKWVKVSFHSSLEDQGGQAKMVAGLIQALSGALVYPDLGNVETNRSVPGFVSPRLGQGPSDPP